MILRKTTLLAASSLWPLTSAQSAPEITTITEGYTLIAKLPCTACPFLYQESSSGPWKSRHDENALLLNISLPFDSPHLTINTAPLLLSPSPLPPRIHATQVPLSTSAADLSRALETNQLDALGHVTFGLSYRYSLRRLTSPSALVFTFDVFAAWSEPRTVNLDDPAQKVLEVVLLRRPLQSAGDALDVYEIVRAGLVTRAVLDKNVKWQTMRYHDWDSHGEVGTPAHFVSTAEESFVEYIASGVWSLFIFIMALIALFVVLCLFCIFGCGLGRDEYASAQQGKRRIGGRGGRSDVERGKGRFLSAEELGLRAGGRVVGVGKAD